MFGIIYKNSMSDPAKCKKHAQPHKFNCSQYALPQLRYKCKFKLTQWENWYGSLHTKMSSNSAIQYKNARHILLICHTVLSLQSMNKLMKCLLSDIILHCSINRLSVFCVLISAIGNDFYFSHIDLNMHWKALFVLCYYCFTRNTVEIWTLFCRLTLNPQ